MLSDLIQKMQELAASDGNYRYQVIKITETERNATDIMATYDCSYDDAREIEGMLSTSFNLDKSASSVIIAIKRVTK